METKQATNLQLKADLLPSQHKYSKRPVFKGGQMKIYLKQNKISYVAGDTISGQVLIQQQLPFRARSLIIRFEGFERTTFMAYAKLPKPNVGFKIVPCKEKYVICHSKCVVASFKEGLHAEGQYVYKFEVELP